MVFQVDGKIIIHANVVSFHDPWWNRGQLQSGLKIWAWLGLLVPEDNLLRFWLGWLGSTIWPMPLLLQLLRLPRPTTAARPLPPSWSLQPLEPVSMAPAPKISLFFPTLTLMALLSRLRLLPSACNEYRQQKPAFGLLPAVPVSEIFLQYVESRQVEPERERCGGRAGLLSGATLSPALPARNPFC
jgi:hypothetical protein